jgi:endonuclease YncB( thermonuclease family)
MTPVSACSAWILQSAASRALLKPLSGSRIWLANIVRVEFGSRQEDRYGRILYYVYTQD